MGILDMSGMMFKLAALVAEDKTKTKIAKLISSADIA